MPVSTYAGNKLLDLMLRGVAFTAPARVYVSLHTADPGLTGASEVSTGAWPAYVRKDPADGAAVASGFDAADAKATENAKDILWPAMDGAGDVTVTHFAIWDATTAGNCLWGGELDAPRVMSPTDEVVFRIGQLDLLVD